MQDANQDLIQLGENSTRTYDISTVASQYSFVDFTNGSESHDIRSNSEEGRVLTREAGELRIKGVDFTNQALNTIIHKILDKVELQDMPQKRLTSLFCRILTFISEYLQDKIETDSKTNGVQEVGESLHVSGKDIFSPYDKRKFCELVDKIEENVKNSHELLQSENNYNFIDGIILDETGKKVTNHNLDDLVTTLFDGILVLKLDEDSTIDHFKFNEFIDEILGKETREYITEKLKTFAAVQQSNNDYKPNI